MNSQQSLFKKKELVLAVSVAMLGGVMTGCSSDGDSSGPGGYTINASGGSGGYSGGDGAEGLYIGNSGGTGGVEVSTSGKADTAFTSPIIAPSADLGSNPLEITANTTIDTFFSSYNTTPDAYGGTATWVGVDALYVGTDNVLYMDDGDGYAGITGGIPGNPDYAPDTSAHNPKSSLSRLFPQKVSKASL